MNADEPQPQHTMFAKIQRTMKARGLKNKALALHLGVDEPRISKWFAGTGEMAAHQAWEAARWLGVPVEFLLDDAMAEPPPRDGKSRVVTEWESIVLQQAHECSQADDDPRLLLTARRRLAGLGLPTEARAAGEKVQPPAPAPARAPNDKGRSNKSG